MKRTIYLLGRLGTNLFVIGLALLLLYSIPSASFSGTSQTPLQISAQKFQLITSFPLSPTRGIHWEVESNASFRFLLLAVIEQDIYTIPADYAALQAYLSTYPNHILLDVTGKAGLTLAEDYTPNSNVNASIAIANTSQGLMNASALWRFIAAIAPKGTTLLLTEILMPLGLVLAAPWLQQSFVARRRAGVAPK